MMKKKVSITLEKEVVQKLCNLAKKKGCSLSQCINEILRETCGKQYEENPENKKPF